jgi:hypothetical protein
MVVLTDQYHLPDVLSMIGLICQDQVGLANFARAYPISFDRLRPTGKCHLSGARTRGRIWSPTHCTPLPFRSAVKM